MRNSLVRFIGNLVINIIAIVLCLGLIGMIRNNGARLVILVTLILFFLIRFYYDSVGKIYQAAESKALIICDPQGALDSLNRLNRLDFLRRYKKRIFLLYCQLVIDMGEKNDVKEFIEKSEAGKYMQKNETRLNLLMTKLLYYVFYDRNVAREREIRNQLLAKSDKYNRIVLSEGGEQLIRAYCAYAEGQKNQCINCLKKIDPDSMHNHDKAYYYYMYAYSVTNSERDREENTELSREAGDHIPLIHRLLEEL